MQLFVHLLLHKRYRKCGTFCGSSHSFSQNQNNSKICPMLHVSIKTRHWAIPLSTHQKGIGIKTLFYNLLHRELFLNLNRHIRQSTEKHRTLESCISKIPTGVRQKVECPRRPWFHEKWDRNRNACFETCRVSHICHILGRFK